MSHGHARHHFDASGDDDVVGAGHDALGGEVQRLLGRSALAVDRRGRTDSGQPAARTALRPTLNAARRPGRRSP